MNSTLRSEKLHNHFQSTFISKNCIFNWWLEKVVWYQEWQKNLLMRTPVSKINKLEIKLFVFLTLLLFYRFPTMAFCWHGFVPKIRVIKLSDASSICHNQRKYLKFLFLFRKNGPLLKGFRSQKTNNIAQSDYGKGFRQGLT